MTTLRPTKERSRRGGRHDAAGCDRSRSRRSLLRHQSGALHRCRAAAFRPARQPLLADDSQGRLHAAAVPSVRTARVVAARVRDHERRRARHDRRGGADGRRARRRSEHPRYKSATLPSARSRHRRHRRLPHRLRRPRAKTGLQEETIGDTRIWILPNPSGLNANYRPEELAALYRELREWVGNVGLRNGVRSKSKVTKKDACPVLHQIDLRALSTTDTRQAAGATLATTPLRRRCSASPPACRRRRGALRHRSSGARRAHRASGAHREMRRAPDRWRGGSRQDVRR